MGSTPVEQLVRASREMLLAQNALVRATRERDEALCRIAASGVPRRRVGEWARSQLAGAGLGDVLALLGVSDGNVRVILDRGRA